MKLIRLSSNKIVNLEAIARTTWVSDRLSINFIGGYSELFAISDSHELWQALKLHTQTQPESVEVSGLTVEV